MNLGSRRLTFVVLAVVVAICSAAGANGAETAPRLAGPWYTPQELDALITYSKASPTQKRALLSGVAVRTARHP